MSLPNDNNIVTMREPAQPTTAPRTSRQRAVVVQMPSRWGRPEQHTATVITMPTRIDSAESYSEAKSEEPLQQLPSAVRLTLLALFAWLGWPRPTHGKGPGAAGARPWKPVLVMLFSKLQLPVASLRPRRAAVVSLPVGQRREFDSAGVNPRAA